VRTSVRTPPEQEDHAAAIGTGGSGHRAAAVTAQRLTELRAAACLWRRELGVAAACIAAFTIVAVLTTLPAVAGWDARVTAAVNTVVAADTSLRFAAVAVTTLGSPVSIDVLTLVAVVVAWRRRAW
jgi:hypothetical protein